jgi:hypothetical protein
MIELGRGVVTVMCLTAIGIADTNIEIPYFSQADISFLIIIDSDKHIEHIHQYR